MNSMRKGEKRKKNVYLNAFMFEIWSTISSQVLYIDKRKWNRGSINLKDRIQFVIF